MQDFPAIPTLAPSNNVTVILGIDFNDTTQSAQFEIVRDNKKFNVSISAPVGELVQPNTITENDFLSLQGKSVRRQSRNVSVPQNVCLAEKNAQMKTIKSSVLQLTGVNV